MDINICITLMYACSKLNPLCLRWTEQSYVYLQSLLVIGVPSNRTFTFNLCLLLVFRFSSLFLQNKKVQYNCVTHLSLLFVYLLYFKIAMDNPIIFFFFA